MESFKELLSIAWGFAGFILFLYGVVWLVKHFLVIA